MTTEIPTYQIGAVDGFDLMVSHKMASDLDNYSAGIAVYNGDRFYSRPIIAGKQSLLYGPGSVTYEVVKAEIVTVGDTVTREDCPLDPKTYIDNYGYIHIGDSNITTPEMIAANKYYEVTFIPTYHYFNPTNGNEVIETWNDPATFRTMPDNFGIVGDMNRAIPYSMLPDNVLAFNA